MPQISFSLASGKYSNIPKAIIAYNIENPSTPISGEDDFAKEATLQYFQMYITRYRNYRVGIIQEQLETCTDNQWSQVTGILL